MVCLHLHFVAVWIDEQTVCDTDQGDRIAAISGLAPRTLPRVRTEMSLHVLAYNMKRAIKLLGTRNVVAAIRA
jgi:hypothetical protein